MVAQLAVPAAINIISSPIHFLARAPPYAAPIEAANFQYSVLTSNAEPGSRLAVGIR